MELVAYIMLLLIGGLTILLNKNRIFEWVFFPYSVLFLIIVRISGYDIDINTYAETFPNVYPKIYYVKEFVYWYGSHYIYLLFNNDLFTFFAIDFIWMIVLFLTARNIKEPNDKKHSYGLFIILISSFPFFLGYENIYRQLIGGVFALYSYSMVKKNTKSAIFVYMLAIFSHNGILLTIPIYMSKYLFGISHKKRRWYAILTAILLLFLLKTASAFKSAEISTGLTLGYAYYSIFIVTFILLLIKFKLDLNQIFVRFSSLPISIILMSGLLVIGESLISERMGMVFLIFIIFDLFIYSNKIQKTNFKIGFRIGLLFLFSMPVIIFPNALRMLQ